MKKSNSVSNGLKFIILVIFISHIISCTTEDEKECETETVCFGDGTSCIERPVNFEDCFDF